MGDAASVSHLGLPALFWTMFGVALACCLFDLGDARTFLGDIDDQLREVQIRHLLFGGGAWWDSSLPMIASPEPYLSPWSRLVDLPYVCLTMLFAPLLGKERALLLSFEVWPLVMLTVFCLLTSLIYRRFRLPASLVGYLIVATATLLMVFGIWEFVPGRIDHHNAQLLVLLTMIYGLSRWDSWGGRLIGFGAVVSITIALEGLPFIVLIFAGLVGGLIFSAQNAVTVVKHASAVMLVMSLPMGIAMLGPVAAFSTQCDAYSAPYIFLLTGFGLILWTVSSFMPTGRFWLYCFVLGLSAIALLFIFGMVFTPCLAGPYWMIDPVSKAYWFNRVAQEHSALYFIAQGQTAIVLLAVVLASILTFATAAIVEERGPNWFGLAIMLALAWVSLVLTLLLNRYIRFAFAFAPLFLPLALMYFTAPRHQSFSRLWRNVAVACCGFYVAIAAWFIAVTPVEEPLYDAVDYMAYDECEKADFSVFGTVEPGRMIAPLGVSLPMLDVLPSGFSVAAIPFHRASPGMKRVFEAFVSDDATVRREALAPFDYVAICRFPLKPDYGTASLYDALSTGRDWPGLIRLPTGADNPFQLFRIDHAALQ